MWQCLCAHLYYFVQAYCRKAIRITGGPETEGQTPQGSDPVIFSGIRSGDLDALRSMLARDAGVLAARDALGRTALHVAASSENAAVVQELIQAGAEIDSRGTIIGQTPLYDAVRSGSYFRTGPTSMRLIITGRRLFGRCFPKTWKRVTFCWNTVLSPTCKTVKGSRP